MDWADPALDGRYLQTFYAVCQSGGFSRAATRLHRSQPAISYQVRMLEQQLGARLFERPARRLLLTPAGRRLRAFCHAHFAEMERTARELSGREPEPGEPLRIAAVSGFGRYVLFPLLCSRRFRSLRFELLFREASEVFERVEAGTCDLGVVYLARVSNYLRFHPAGVEEAVLIAPPGLALKPLRSAADYAALPFVTYVESDYVFGRWFGTQIGEQPPLAPSAHHVEELEEVVELVRRGRGLSIVPDHSAAAAIRRGAVRVVRPGGRRCRNRVFAVTRTGAIHAPGVPELLQALAARRSPRERDPSAG